MEDKKIKQAIIEDHKPKTPVMDFKLYAPVQEQKPQKQNRLNPTLWKVADTTNPLFAHDVADRIQYPMYKPADVPIVNNYNVNVGGPEFNHVKISRIFEDILPSNNLKETYKNLSERKTMLEFLRSVFIQDQDGGHINMDGNKSGETCLNSYLKFLNLNPAFTNAYAINPYVNLPKNLLIYQSCYPIRYDSKTNRISCAKNSIPLNVRIYRLKEDEYNVKKNKDTPINKFDIWRELMFYEYVREKIIKTRQSPNFVMIYMYFIDEQSVVNFSSYEKARQVNKEQRLFQPKKNSSVSQSGGSKNSNNYDHDNENNQNGGNPIFIPKDSMNLPQQALPKMNYPVFNPLFNPNDPRPPHIAMNDPKGFGSSLIAPKPKYNVSPNVFNKALITLTESPTMNIFDWASKIYNKEGNIQKMINTGYHSTEVWMSVLFQLMIILYTLQIHGIVFKNFKIQENIHIKELHYHNNVNSYWKYIVDGIEYFVPNQGYLVLFDSNYKEINSTTESLKQQTNKHRIYSNIFRMNNSDEKYNKEQLNDLAFETFKMVISPNTFSGSFVNMGGVRPPEDILNLLNSINLDAQTIQNKDIGFYIRKHMTPFMNNRVGTYILNSEEPLIRHSDVSPFRSGELIAYETDSDAYKFAIFISEHGENLSSILTKETEESDIIEKQVPNSQLNHISKSSTISQNFSAGQGTINPSNLIETYYLNKN